MTAQKTPAEQREGRWRWLLGRALDDLGDHSGIALTDGQRAALVATLDAQSTDDHLQLVWVAEYEEMVLAAISECDDAYRVSEEFLPKAFWATKRAAFTKLFNQLNGMEEPS